MVGTADRCSGVASDANYLRFDDDRIRQLMLRSRVSDSLAALSPITSKVSKRHPDQHLEIVSITPTLPEQRAIPHAYVESLERTPLRGVENCDLQSRCFEVAHAPPPHHHSRNIPRVNQRTHPIGSTNHPELVSSAIPPPEVCLCYCTAGGTWCRAGGGHEAARHSSHDGPSPSEK